VPPDYLGFATAKNSENFATSGWKDCSPIQYGLSKMMCDLYCIEGAVKEGDTVILQSIQDSHNTLMTNMELLLEHQTQTFLWGMGQLRDELQSPGGSSLLFYPARDRQDLLAGNVPNDAARALSELQALPQLLRLELPPDSNNSVTRTPVSAETAAWHSDAAERLLRALQRTLEKHLVPGGDAVSVAKHAKELVQRFSSQRALHLKGGAGSSHPIWKMTQEKAAALRRQLGDSKELLETSRMTQRKHAAPPNGVTMAWYGEVSSGFVAAHELHAAFTQSRQRALQAAEKAVTAAESYVGCGDQELSDLHRLWQRAYRLEDQAISDLLRAWAATVAAQERLGLAVQQGLVETLANTVVLDSEVGLTVSCEDLQQVAEAAHGAAVEALDKALWPLLEQVLALERLANLQERELESKSVSRVERLPVNSSILALHAAARDGANPQSPAGRRLAARALDALGPVTCAAPAACRHGGMLLANSSDSHAGFPRLLWTSPSPGDLLRGKSPAQVAHACDVGLALPVKDAIPVNMQQEGGSLRSIQTAVTHIMADMQKLNVESYVCDVSCEERLRLRLSKKQSALGLLLHHLR